MLNKDLYKSHAGWHGDFCGVLVMFRPQHKTMVGGGPLSNLKESTNTSVAYEEKSMIAYSSTHKRSGEPGDPSRSTRTIYVSFFSTLFAHRRGKCTRFKVNLSYCS